MYAAHQDATLVPIDIRSEKYEHAGYWVPAISASASVGAEGKLHVTLSNVNPGKDVAVTLCVRGLKASKVEGRVLHADAMSAHNTFERPEAVRPRPFKNAQITADGLEIAMPKMSVVALDVMS
jgi:alpha-N-arabinofuranosidase